jgi:Zn-dependent protease
MDSTELTHMLISVVTLSLAFAIHFSNFARMTLLTAIPVVFVTLGVGFILHEMAHRYVARKKGFYSVYRAWLPGLALALGLAVLTRGSLIFAAPGAVYYMSRGPVSSKDNGQIGVAGALMNLLVGGFFLAVSFFAVSMTGSFALILRDVGAIGSGVNFFLAFFNMLPIPPLDGYSVIQWSVPIWGAVFGSALFLTFFF